MKLTHSLVIVASLFLGGTFTLASCTSQQYRYVSEKVIEDEHEIEEISSFIVPGSTTVSEVAKNMGNPSYVVPEVRERTAHVYVWRSIPYVVIAKENGGPDSFDPFGSMDGEGPEEREAYLFLLCDSNGIVQDISIQGPPEG